MADSVLNSWKDIAAHLHTSVRTAQRWEMHFGLPIHRPSGTHKGPVLAFEKELDQWIQAGGATRAAAHNGHSGPPASPDTRHQNIRLRALSAMDRAERMHELAAQISLRAKELRERLERAGAIHAKAMSKSRSLAGADISST